MSYNLETIWSLPEDEIDSILKEVNKENEKGYQERRIIISIISYNRKLLDEYSSNIVKNPNFTNIMMNSKTLNEGLDKLHNDNNILIDDYYIVKKIGEGNKTSVYDVVSADNQNHHLAIKVIENTNDKPNKQRLLDQEIEILKILSNDCNNYVICYIGDIVKDNKQYIITEYLGNYISLLDYIKQNKELPNYIKNNITEFLSIVFNISTIDEYYNPNDILNKSIHEYNIIFNNLCDGLKFLHEKGIVHRDIKPANILIDPINFNIKYIDFGLSCLEENIDLKYNQHKFSTPAYEDPLLKSYRNLTFNDLIKADLYSLGIIIHEMITGVKLYLEFKNNMEIIKNTPKIIKYMEDAYQKFYIELGDNGNFASTFSRIYDYNNYTTNKDINANRFLDILNKYTGNNINLNKLLSRNIDERKYFC